MTATYLCQYLFMQPQIVKALTFLKSISYFLNEISPITTRPVNHLKVTAINFEEHGFILENYTH